MGPSVLLISRVVLLVGVLLLLLAASGVAFGTVQLVPLGLAVCFGAWLVREA